MEERTEPHGRYDGCVDACRDPVRPYARVLHHPDDSSTKSGSGSCPQPDREGLGRLSEQEERGRVEKRGGEGRRAYR